MMHHSDGQPVISVERLLTDPQEGDSFVNSIASDPLQNNRQTQVLSCHVSAITKDACEFSLKQLMQTSVSKDENASRRITLSELEDSIRRSS